MMFDLESFRNCPERIRQLSDDEFQSIYSLFMKQHQALIVPGTYDQSLAQEYSDYVKFWAVRINEGEKAGQAVFIPNIPKG